MRTTLLKISATVLLGLLLSIPSISQEKNLEEFDRYIKNAVEQYELPGLSIAITDEKKILFENSYGVKNVETGKKINTKSVFAIASLSKAFTAAALGMLVDEGKIKWSDKVVKYIPEFRLVDTNVSNAFTIEELLSHRSGFETFDGDLLWYGTDYTRNEIITRFKEHKLSYEYRERYGYQNIMFIIAGEIIPVVTGMSWDEFIEKRIFEPLNMTSSYTSINDFPNNIDIAEPHVKGKLDDVRNYDNSGGAAAINSNVEDLTKWIQMWLNEGVMNGDTIIQPSTINELLNLNTPMDPTNFDRQNKVEFKGYALGWFLMQYDGKKVAHHGGGLPGYISKIFIVPSEKLGGVILTNGESSLPAALMYKSLDTFLSTENTRDWAETYLSFTKNYEESLEKKQQLITENRKKNTNPSLDITSYTGTYIDKMYGNAKVELKNGKLYVTLLPSKQIFTSEMKHWENDSFEIKFKDQFLPRGFVNFEVEDKEVKAFTIDLPNPDFHFYNLKFEKKDN